MNDVLRKFKKDHADTLICEPSGRTYAELLQDRNQLLNVDDFVEKLATVMKKQEK